MQGVIVAAGGGLGWFLGGWDGFIYALVGFVTVDYVTGILRAVVEKKLSSQIGAKGIVKKVLIFLIVGAANIADVYLLHDGNALRTAVIFFYVSNEAISLLENAAILGLPIPAKLKETLAQLQKHKSTKESEDRKNVK